MKAEYIQQITKQMHICNDVALLDLIYRLLLKSAGENGK